jgi:hypothetical protein
MVLEHTVTLLGMASDELVHAFTAKTAYARRELCTIC